MPAALLSPFGHEFLIVMGNKREFSKAPLFAALKNGVKILDVFPRSPAAAAGLSSGQVILAVNGLPVNDSLAFQSIIGLAGSKVELEIQGEKNSIELKSSHGGATGIILAPDQFTTVYLEVKQARFLAAFVKKSKPPNLR